MNKQTAPKDNERNEMLADFNVKHQIPFVYLKSDKIDNNLELLDNHQNDLKHDHTKNEPNCVGAPPTTFHCKSASFEHLDGEIGAVHME